MRSKRKIVAIDCETDPFLYGRIPAPFIWGSYDGKTFEYFNSGKELLDRWSDKNVYLFAHNGGKFDFMFLLDFVGESRVRLINSRIVEMRIGKALLRDSFAIIPTALAAFEKDKFEYWKLEKEHRVEYRDEIITYLKSDCVNLFNLVSEYFALAGNKCTIASNALAQSKSLGIDPGKTTHRFDNVFREFYFGGRVEAFSPGIHKNIHILDIKSSYPFAMSHFHPSGCNYFLDDNLNYTEEDIKKSFIDISCYSRKAFPLRTKTGLSFPECFSRFKITGWEFIIAKKHHLIDNVKIHAIYFLENDITFKDYVDHWFTIKDEADKQGHKAQRLIAKIMLNSLYGKLAQNPIKYFDYKILPACSIIDWENGWQLDAQFGTKELHSRSVLWRYEKKYGDDWIKFPMYYNVATAASITGFARAHLLDAIHTIGPKNVLYCDTDCVFTRENSPNHYLNQNGKIGSWAWEGLADPAYIAGKKMYGLTFVNGPKTGETKLAHKGAKLTMNDIKNLCEGGSVIWQNPAPSFSLKNGAKFVKRTITKTA